jgi:YVTN family beta-propeller protein
MAAGGRVAATNAGPCCRIMASFRQGSFALSVVIAISLAALAPVRANAQTAIATIAAGDTPFAIAVNPVTNKIYVANRQGNSLTVIDGATRATVTVEVGIRPEGVAVNPVTNKVYVANVAPGTLSVIDGVTNAVTATLRMGSNSQTIAINTTTNKIYGQTILATA